MLESIVDVHFRPWPGQAGHCFACQRSRVVTFRLYGAGKGADARHNSHSVRTAPKASPSRVAPVLTASKER